MSHECVRRCKTQLSEFDRKKKKKWQRSFRKWLQYRHAFRLVRMRLSSPSDQRFQLKFSRPCSQWASPGQHRHGVPWHARELKGERPVKQHNDDTEHPFEDGRGVLQDETFLAEKHTAWKMWLRKIQIQNRPIPCNLNQGFVLHCFAKVFILCILPRWGHNF